jgi:hypothetical protein
MQRPILAAAAALMLAGTITALPAPGWSAGPGLFDSAKPRQNDARALRRELVATLASARTSGRAAATAGNRARVSQQGDGNSVAISQSGNGNLAIVRQVGDGHEATLVQDGNRNRAVIIQVGKPSSVNVEQLGNGGRTVRWVFGH